MKRSYDRWDLVLFILSLGGTFLTLTASLALVVLGLVSFAGGDEEAARAVQWSATGMATLAVMGVAPLISTSRRIFGAAPPVMRTPRRAWLALLLLLPFGLLLGYLAFEQDLLPALLGPAGQVLAIGAPAGALIVYLRREGPSHRPRRAWTHYLLGLWAVPIVALIAEGVFLLLTALLGAGALYLSPEGRSLLRGFEDLAESLDTTVPPDSLIDLVRHPIVIVLLLIFLGVLVPIVEETLKTAVIWPFLPGGLSSDQAFLGGALGGVGFAVAEALFVTQPVTGWLITAVARSGATLMHALASGVACWGLAEVWVNKRWGRGLLAGLAATSLHGLWNASAVAIGVSQLSREGSAAGTLAPLSIAGVSILLTLAAMALIGLPSLLHLAKRLEGRMPDRQGSP